MDEANDVVAAGAEIGQEPIVELMQPADGQTAFAPGVKLAGNGIKQHFQVLKFETQSRSRSRNMGSGSAFLIVGMIVTTRFCSAGKDFIAHWWGLALDLRMQ